jgi:8-oxo-dGTP diphosphatase
MRRRRSARLLIIEPTGRVLLFRFVFKKGSLAGEDYWATPGGGVEEGETFEQTAIRELREETGIRVESVGPQVGQREFVLQLSDGAVLSPIRHLDQLGQLTPDPRLLRIACRPSQ